MLGASEVLMRSVLLPAIVLLFAWAPGCGLGSAPSVEQVPDTGGGGEDTQLEDTAPPRTHPEGYAEAAVHGAEARLQTLGCTSCHGEDLLGLGRASSCDACHPEGWRSDCTFCHGGLEDSTGAPPLHISGVDDGEEARFIPHQAHAQDTSLHAAFGCEQCHALPADALSEGHLFVGDDTPARAEVDFSGGLDPSVGWDDSRTCVSSYCHGDGQGAAGRVEHQETLEGCGGCHEAPDAGPGGWARMTGEHEAHLDRGLSCHHCHQDVVTEDGEAIAQPSLHVDGAVQVTIGDTWVSWEGGSCDGLCHTDGFWYWHWSSGWEE
jgi:hypothetical protein